MLYAVRLIDHSGFDAWHQQPGAEPRRRLVPKEQRSLMDRSAALEVARSYRGEYSRAQVKLVRVATKSDRTTTREELLDVASKAMDAAEPSEHHTKELRRMLHGYNWTHYAELEQTLKLTARLADLIRAHLKSCECRTGHERPLWRLDGHAELLAEVDGHMKTVQERKARLPSRREFE